MFILFVGEGTTPKFFMLLPLRTSFLLRSGTLSYYPYTLKNIHIILKIDTTRLFEVSGIPPTVRLLHLTKGSTQVVTFFIQQFMLYFSVEAAIQLFNITCFALNILY
jgi:hypothetical protein